MDRFLITGTGRCGTAYTALLLSRMGLMTGHELVFTPGNGPETEWGPYPGESSWIAAPFAGALGIPWVHLVRNPLDVVRSLVGIEFFARNEPAHAPYEATVFATLDWHPEPSTEREELITRACRFVSEWTALIERQQPTLTITVEALAEPAAAQRLHTTLTGEPLAEPLLRQVLAHKDRRHNTRTRDETVTWEELTPTVREWARQHGYGET